MELELVGEKKSDYSNEIKKIYSDIQRKIFYMIPEKWNKIYLYASIIDNTNSDITGEMFFYYFPKGLIKKNPINVYEIPNKFNINESDYLKLVDKLYNTIKKLRKLQISNNEKAWSNLIISIENLKFIMEYNYEDLANNIYSSYERHIIWRHIYLKIPLEGFNKKEKKLIEYYLSHADLEKKDKKTYIESMYSQKVHNVVEYQTEEFIKEKKENQIYEEKKKNQILNIN